MNYEQAERKLATARNRAHGKPHGSSTRLVDCTVTIELIIGSGQTITRAVKAIGVKYHDTIVVAIMEDGRYRINTGGWYTKTTKERIEQTIGLRIRAVGISFDTIRTTSNRDWRLPYGDQVQDGVIIDADWSSTDVIASITESTSNATSGRPYYATTGAMGGCQYTSPSQDRAIYNAHMNRQRDPLEYVAPQAHNFQTYPDTAMDETTFSMRFDEMNEEAEKEMEAWSDMLKGGKK
jgi:hypothetical protein